MIKRICTILFWIFFSILFLLHAIINGACDWYNIKFGVTFEEILFTITSPLVGADVSFLNEAVIFTLPYITDAIAPLSLILVGAYVLHKATIYIHLKIRKFHIKINPKPIYIVLCLICTFSLLSTSVNYAVSSLALDSYIERKLQATTIYEEYYVDPSNVSITCEGKPKNLIYIYVESMETTYASVEDGGMQTINYIPNLTQLANENTSFSDTDSLGGAYITTGAGWTMGALFSTTTGIPFSFPIEGNSMEQMDTFATGVTSLGDLLHEYGYTQKFLCGSDGTFAGRQTYFEQHGNYEMLDYHYAIEEGYIPSDYFVFWGYEDVKLYEIAKTELSKISSEEAPFNFTILTVDTHHIDGYICERCNATYNHQLGNVLECTDNLLYEFILWCQQQDFYEDTVIVITGDHFRMDSSLVAEAAELDQRRLYNCIINSDTAIELDNKNRIFTSLDIFPTTLSAMGYHIEGERLGLGTNLYSTTPTLAEELGFEKFNEELGKYSNFYVENFE